MILFKSDSLIELEKALINILIRKDIDRIIFDAYNFIEKERNWCNNVKLYKKIYSKLSYGK